MTRHKHYEVAIIGLGTMGSFAALELCKRGLRVAGFDRFMPPHGHGSHSGVTRIYRVAYAEGDTYVPLAQHAGVLWDQASEEFGTQLLHRVGMLYMGHPEGPFVRQVAQSASINHLPAEKLSAKDVRDRYPAFAIPEDFAGIFDPQAGWIDVDASIASALDRARVLGAECFFDDPVQRWEVQGWEATAPEVRVHLGNETVTAAKLIITAGAWTGELLQQLRLPLKVKRKVLAWFDPLDPELFAPGRIPIFSFPDNWTYGFPNMPGMGVKMAEHLGGDFCDANGAIAPPGPADLVPIAATAAKYMPRLAGDYNRARSRLRHAATCLYTMTPDDHFIVDHHPQYKNVVFAAGFSGHGFKFAPVIARVLADLLMEGKTSLPVGFLSLDRLLQRAQ
jgi:monomeric sarcosine oxidase